MDAGSIEYGGFWRRLGALLLDLLVNVPIMALFIWGEQYRAFDIWSFIPSQIVGLFYSVYLVKRFGGTPGKLIAGLQIRKVNGELIGYKEAFLRNLPDFIFGLLISIAMLAAVLGMSDAQYHSYGFMERAQREAELAPSWLKPLQGLQNVWTWSEFLILLTNRKKRALHDFIAGTVVIVARPKTATAASLVAAQAE